MTISEEDIGPGRLIAGVYRVVEVVATGEVTHVRATQGDAGTPVTLELRRFVDAMTRRRAERAHRSAAAVRVENPHVVGYLDAGIDEGVGLGWVAFEAAPGEPLTAVLAARGALPPREVFALVQQVAEAVVAARGVGVTHPSLEASCVLLGPPLDGAAPYHVKVAGFRGHSGDDDDAVASRLKARRGQSSRPPADSGVARDIAALAQLTRRMLAPESAPPSTLLPDVEWYEGATRPILPPGFEAWFARSVGRGEAEPFATVREALAALAACLGAQSPSGDRPAQRDRVTSLVPAAPSVPPLASWSAPSASGLASVPPPAPSMPPRVRWVWLGVIAFVLVVMVLASATILGRSWV